MINTDIENIINGPDYFYCLRAKCRMLLPVCVKRQQLNKDYIADRYSFYMCKGCPGLRVKCWLHLPVCLKSPNGNTSNQYFSICESCRQGKENIIIAEDRDEKQKICARIA